MIRFFVLTGIVGGALVAYLTTFGVGPIAQLPPAESLLTKFREEGKMPENKSLAIDETAEELEVFEVPEQDLINLEVAKAAYKEMTDGMDMDGMDMSGSQSGTMNMDDSDGSTMKMEGDGDAASGTMNMAADGEGGNASGTMNMAADANAPTMNMAADAEGGTATGTMNMGDANAPNMNMAADAEGTNATGTMKMGDDDASGMKMAANDTDTGNPIGHAEPEDGLAFFDGGSFDREINLDMAEWEFSEMSIDVKMGERIKFTVKNDGEIPHEFMFMSPPLMNAVTYRATRADWNLYEHEALFEQALVLPGGEFTFVLEVTNPGSWMFMCMLPYHMQLGMMGQMATAGMAMDM